MYVILSEDKKLMASKGKILSVFFLCLSFVLSSFILSACDNEVQTETAEFFVFDTVVNITAYGENGGKAIEAVRDELYRYDDLLSTENKNSDIYKLNSNETDKVSEETAQIIERSLKISEVTEGSLDITVYPLSKLWGFIGGNYNVPNQEDIEKVLENVGYDKIALADGTVLKDSDDVEIDLGATAKGYIGDRIAETLKNSGCDSAVVSIGGNVVTVGKKNQKEDFNVGVTWIDGKGICASVALSDISAITSGAYQRNFTENGVFYHHIIDPKTGYPANSDIGSVTIFSTDGLIADGLSTAFFVMGSEKTLDFYNSRKYLELGIESLDFFIVKNDGQCIVTENIYNKMSLNSEYINESNVTVI